MNKSKNIVTNDIETFPKTKYKGQLSTEKDVMKFEKLSCNTFKNVF